MLKSMTGFGKASGTFQSKKISVEIRSLNSKSMDLNVRIPSLFKELDSAIRKFVSNELGRGKIDVFINLDSIGEESNVSINQGLAKKYFTELKALNDAVGTSTDDYLTLIMRMPDVIENAKEDLSEEEKQWLMALVKEAAQKLNEFRRKEGQDLEREFSERIDEIRGFLSEVHQYEDARIQTIRERMKKGLEDIDAGHDENRFEQEMIFYIEKLDISEEKMRLSNHLDYFEETMKLEQSGKKLGFIGQEIGREINTLGSKSNHAEMQKLVIGMKDNLEKIKEQILNTL
ncbi:MAG: YicC family protein [Crocinitomicaceae bacterium]|nr:YicC family protein [Crocinitomicaceae bacterium]MDG1742685.1 YicC family protein [Crocinitomicaceae bacterium]